jgi:DNA-binding MarR family transcriptional regulator
MTAVSTSIEQQRFDRLVNLPPSAKLVFRVLQHDQPLTSQDIAEKTLLPKRTVRDALSKLNDADLAEKHTDPRQPRTRLYTSLPVAESGR